MDRKRKSPRGSLGVFSSNCMSKDVLKQTYIVRTAEIQNVRGTAVGFAASRHSYLYVRDSVLFEYLSHRRSLHIMSWRPLLMLDISGIRPQRLASRRSSLPLPAMSQSYPICLGIMPCGAAECYPNSHTIPQETQQTVDEEGTHAPRRSVDSYAAFKLRR
eukprot:6213026-Pleurochrysis_carterae.AAC.3